MEWSWGVSVGFDGANGPSLLSSTSHRIFAVRLESAALRKEGRSIGVDADRVFPEGALPCHPQGPTKGAEITEPRQRLWVATDSERLSWGVDDKTLDTYQLEPRGQWSIHLSGQGAITVFGLRAHGIIEETGKPRAEAVSMELLPSLDSLCYYAKNARKFLKPQRKRILDKLLSIEKLPDGVRAKDIIAGNKPALDAYRKVLEPLW